jgi:hypothetical protein
LEKQKRIAIHFNDEEYTELEQFSNSAKTNKFLNAWKWFSELRQNAGIVVEVCYNQTEKEGYMTIAKQQIFELIKDLPEEVDIEEIIYRLYLRQKLEVAEKDVREGRVISHEEVVKETSKWFKK